MEALLSYNYPKVDRFCYDAFSFLALYLPYLTKQEESNAKWEVDTERLIITMPIVREFVA
jgi:hypothetical protein